MKIKLIVSACVMALCLAIVPTLVASQETEFEWESDWAVLPGFSISLDSEGFRFPTAIAFVPNPGPAPDDPLYFITELHGVVKVVTNDRSIHTFAEGFIPTGLNDDFSDRESQLGAAGICLAPEQGYVFVTYAYLDANGIPRNAIVRLQATPDTFSLQATAQRTFAELFAPYRSDNHHQIGPCQVNDALLYVSVGEGNQPLESQNIGSLLGKIVRMTLDGEAVAENPFYSAENDELAAENYVWAYGLRNPFGLKIVEDRVFVADNGDRVDRFLEVREGENYLWDGSDLSISSAAAVVFTPVIVPVQTDYSAQGRTYLPVTYEHHFFVATAGNLDVEGRRNQHPPAIMMFRYDLEASRVTSVPKYFLFYRGQAVQQLVGLAFGPDGLYFVPIRPNQAGLTGVFKITYDSANQHPFTINENLEAVSLMREKGCLSCHSRGGEGEVVGPPLDREALIASIQARVNSEEYRNSVRDLDQLEEEPFRSFREARGEVLAAEGEEQVRIWLMYRLQEPLFDNRNAEMPNPGLSERQAQTIADHLLTEPVEPSIVERIMEAVIGVRDRYPSRWRYVLFAFVGGFAFALLGVWGVTRLRSRTGA